MGNQMVKFLTIFAIQIKKT